MHRGRVPLTSRRRRSSWDDSLKHSTKACGTPGGKAGRFFAAPGTGRRIGNIFVQRYHRQIIIPQIGSEGQEKLGAAKVLVIGCGALGSVICEQLTRAGVGTLRIVDRDIVELTNLQRQTLFTEYDVKQGLPKAVAAANRLAQINSQVRIEPVIRDLDGGNIEQLLPVNLILDGTDNVETR